MKIELEFDFEPTVIYVPDGYVKNLKSLQQDFFSWMYDREEYVTEFGGYEYDESAFLRYVNEVVLINSDEKAYILNENEGDGKIIGKLSF